MSPLPNEHSSVKVSARHRTVWPSLRWVLRSPHRLLAFGFGSGLLRPGAGTWGTLLAWLLWIVSTDYHSDEHVAVVLVVGLVYGSWACGRVCRELGVHDHVGIVWDEIVAFWLVLWLTPSTWLWQLIAFGLFRFFDIVKPGGIKKIDATIKGGIGVMVDDLVAAAYSLLVIAILVQVGERL